MASAAILVMSPSRKRILRPDGLVQSIFSIYYNLLMTRRELLAAGAVCASGLFTKAQAKGIDKSRISAITDEIGLTTDESIAFAHKYGMSNIELRNPPKNEPNARKEYFQLSEAEMKADAARFKAEGLQVSFINTSLLKFTWPDT